MTYAAPSSIVLPSSAAVVCTFSNILAIMIFQQLTGINVIMFFSSRIAGGDPWVPPIIGVCNFASTIVVCALVDRIHVHSQTV